MINRFLQLLTISNYITTVAVFSPRVIHRIPGNGTLPADYSVIRCANSDLTGSRCLGKNLRRVGDISLYLVSPIIDVNYLDGCALPHGEQSLVRLEKKKQNSWFL